MLVRVTWEIDRAGCRARGDPKHLRHRRRLRWKQNIHFISVGWIGCGGWICSRTYQMDAEAISLGSLGHEATYTEHGS